MLYGYSNTHRPNISSGVSSSEEQQNRQRPIAQQKQGKGRSQQWLSGRAGNKLKPHLLIAKAPVADGIPYMDN